MGTLNKLNFVVIIFYVFMFTTSALAQENCYYDPKGVDYNYFLKHTKFPRAEWNDAKKEARIAIENEDEIVIGYAACYEFGVNAKYKMARSIARPNSEFLIEKILWLGGQILAKSDYDLLVVAIKNEHFINDLNNLKKKERVFVGVEGSDYQSFLVYVVYDRTNFYVEISWNM
jgi:hypothetical protein